MNNKSVLAVVALLFCLCTSSYAQSYAALVGQAEKLADEQSYTKSLDAYRQAFALTYKSNEDIYNAACIAALAGEPEIAFAWLHVAIERGWDNLDHLKSDKDLLALHGEKKWPEILAALQRKIADLERDYDKPLQKRLLDILNKDQANRRTLGALEGKFGANSKEVKDLWLEIHRTDAENLAEVKAMIGQYGWVGPSLVGDRASNAQFLVIQHSDKQTREYYLPLMREAVKQHKAKPSSLALMEDRFAFETKGKQIYGSQVIADKEGAPMVAPIEDPDNVDKLRASVGLAPLADYLMHWKIVWDVEVHKRQTQTP